MENPKPTLEEISKSVEGNEHYLALSKYTMKGKGGEKRRNLLGVATYYLGKECPSSEFDRLFGDKLEVVTVLRSLEDRMKNDSDYELVLHNFSASSGYLILKKRQ